MAKWRNFERNHVCWTDIWWCKGEIDVSRNDVKRGITVFGFTILAPCVGWRYDLWSHLVSRNTWRNTTMTTVWRMWITKANIFNTSDHNIDNVPKVGWKFLKNFLLVMDGNELWLINVQVYLRPAQRHFIWRHSNNPSVKKGLSNVIEEKPIS